MRLFLVKVELLLLASVLAAVLCSSATAAPPFIIDKPVSENIQTDPVNGACDAYNSRVSTSGVFLNGAGHHGSCQFSEAKIGLNGLPIDQFWQAVIAGAVKRPYQVTYSNSGRFSLCGTASALKFAVSINLQTARLSFPGAASVGSACVREWNQHDPAFLVDASPPKGVILQLEKLVDDLNRKLPGSFKSCANLALGGQSLQTQVLVGLAAQVRQYISYIASKYPLSWSPPFASGQDCMLHCNVCSSGWAGIIKLKKSFTADGQNYFNPTETWYVGGPSTGGNRFPAEWIASGSGTYTMSPTLLKWNLTTDVPGQCNPLTTASCIQVLTSGGNTTFSEVSSPFTVQTTSACNWNSPGYSYTQSSAQTVPSCAGAEETTINYIAPLISMTATATEAVGQSPPQTSCPERPPQNPGTYSCTQTWNWELYNQP